jgi:hypothetical protein
LIVRAIAGGLTMGSLYLDRSGGLITAPVAPSE